MAKRDMGTRTMTNSEMQDRTTTVIVGPDQEGVRERDSAREEVLAAL